METRTEIYALAELEGGYFYVVEKKDMKYLDEMKNELECSDCLYTIGDSGEVGIADYAEELMWYPQIKERYVRDLTESDRKAISEAIEEAERKRLEAMEQYEMEFFSDKNEQMKHLRKGFIELLDNTLCYDFDWKADYFEQAKEEIEEAKNIHELRDLFEEFYNYVRNIGDDDDWMEQFQEFGHDELEVRFCDKCGCMMVQGFYFPSFCPDGYEETPTYMCDDCYEKMPQDFKEKWNDYYTYTDECEDCWTQWEC